VTIVDFITNELRDPETGKPFVLFDAQTRFLLTAFTLTDAGTFPYPEMLFGAIKKSGKTATAAMAALYVLVTGGPFAEIIIAANDEEQAQGRIFAACVRIVEASPRLRPHCKITASRIEYLPTGGTIIAIANDYKGAAGANPTLTVVDEPWGIISESSHRLWDELVPSPARALSARLSVSYAGFEGESDVLWTLYQRGLRGEPLGPDLVAGAGMLMAWHREPIAPWQTADWVEQMRATLRPNAFLRMIQNQWVSSEGSFIELDVYDACVHPAARPIVADRSLSIDVGIDASTKRDSTAIVWVAWDKARKAAQLVGHRIFQPTPERPLDFEGTIEATVLELRERFHVRSVRFDPYQMAATSQRLARAGLPMIEFPQSTGNLTEASSNLYELFKGRNIVLYDAPEIRLAVSRAVAIEGARGWRIGKEKSAHRIDVVIALAQAALGATLGQRRASSGVVYLECDQQPTPRPVPSRPLLPTREYPREQPRFVRMR
jgi:phage terminase large subunit-like protein